MRNKGRLVSLIIIISIGLISILAHQYYDSYYMKCIGIAGVVIYVVIALLFGRQYDITKSYADKLKRSQEDLQHMFQNIDAVVWSYDFDTNEYSISQGIDSVHGYDKNLFKSDPLLWKSILHPDDVEIFNQGLADAMSGLKVLKEYRVIKADGREVWIQGIMSPLYDEWGNLKRVNGLCLEISDRKAMETALIEAESKYRSLVEGALIGVYIFQHGRLTYVNPSFEKMFGFKLEELSQIDVMDYIYPEDRDTILNNIKRLGNEDRKIIEEIKVYRKNGEEFHVKINAISTIYNGKHAIIGTILDATDEKRAIEALSKNEKLLSDIFDSIQDGLVVIDTNFNIIRTNKTMDEWYKDAVPLVGQKCHKVSTNRSDAVCEGCPSINAMETAEPQTLVFDYLDEHGEKHWRELYTYPLIDDAGNVSGVIEQIKDVTEKKKAEDRISQMALHDELTGLPNRYRMRSHLKTLLNNPNIKNEKLGVIFIDLDRFKMINDTMGHSYGDMLLKQVSSRMRSSIRNGDIISRHGGDEFVIVLENIDKEIVEQVATRIIDEMSNPFVVDGHEVFISPSIGISMYPDDGEDAETLIKHSDAAMYLAKEKGKNNYQFYSESLNMKMIRKLSLENGLRRALDNKEFVLHYQPQINLNNGKMVGMEALIRWRHPELGLVSPAEFIPVAEETGLILSIGKWVLETACKQNKEWQNMGFSPMSVAVNISAKQFQQKDFVASVKKILEEAELAPEYLEIEITEGIMIDIEELSKILKEFKSIGIRISIDDFGTGYSSLGILKHLPIDILKIDKSFVNGIAGNEKTSALVKTIIDMGYSLNFKVIAEGVETPEQAVFLTNNRCNLGQGYLFSHPLPAGEVVKFLRK